VGAKELLEQIKEAVINGKRKDSAALCQQGLAQNAPAADMLNLGLLEGMQEVGRRFRAGEFYIPEVLVAARAMNAGLEVLKPELAKNPPKKLGRVVLGTVMGDLHDIGKNLVGIMLTGSGFDVVDLGIDVSPAKFSEAAVSNKACAVAMSALLTTTMVNMKDVIGELRKSGFKGKVIIGGAPVTQEFADKVGADLYAADAAEGADKLRAAVAA
jgi:5-methyltetrahydrofolate--homocysteine methyltransferase